MNRLVHSFGVKGCVYLEELFKPITERAIKGLRDDLKRRGYLILTLDLRRDYDILYRHTSYLVRADAIYLGKRKVRDRKSKPLRDAILAAHEQPTYIRFKVN